MVLGLLISHISFYIVIQNSIFKAGIRWARYIMVRVSRQLYD